MSILQQIRPARGSSTVVYFARTTRLWPSTATRAVALAETGAVPAGGNPARVARSVTAAAAAAGMVEAAKATRAGSRPCQTCETSRIGAACADGRCARSRTVPSADRHARRGQRRTFACVPPYPSKTCAPWCRRRPTRPSTRFRSRHSPRRLPRAKTEARTEAAPRLRRGDGARASDRPAGWPSLPEARVDHCPVRTRHASNHHCSSRCQNRSRRRLKRRRGWASDRLFCTCRTFHQGQDTGARQPQDRCRCT